MWKSLVSSIIIILIAYTLGRYEGYRCGKEDAVQAMTEYLMKHAHITIIKKDGATTQPSAIIEPQIVMSKE